MKKELSDKLIKQYPNLFDEGRFYFGCDDGWYLLLETLCKDIQEILDRDKTQQIIIDCIKEKFGTLRTYYQPMANLDILEKVTSTEHKSSITCERCGTMKDVKLRNKGWLKTLCNSCNNKEDKNGWDT